MQADYEVFQALGYFNSCAFVLALLFAGVGAVVAGARLKKSVGVWIFAGSILAFAMVSLLSNLLTIADLGVDAMQLLYAFTSLVTLALNIGMLVGVALIKPIASGAGREVRG